MSCSSRNPGHSLWGLSKPNALCQLAGSHWLHCSLHGTKDGSVSHVGALVFLLSVQGEVRGELNAHFH